MDLDTTGNLAAVGTDVQAVAGVEMFYLDHLVRSGASWRDVAREARDVGKSLFGAYALARQRCNEDERAWLGYLREMCRELELPPTHLEALA